MKKKTILAVTICTLFAAGVTNAAEVYNKDAINWMFTVKLMFATILPMQKAGKMGMIHESV